MAVIPLRNIGQGGIVTDQDPYDLELTQFPTGNNVSFESGRIGKANGYNLITDLAFQPTGCGGFLLDSYNSLIVGSINKLYKFNGSTVTDVTKTSDATTYSNSARWELTQAGRAIIANNGADPPQFLLHSGSRFADLTNWPSGATTGSIKNFGSFMVMAGYNTSGTQHPFTVRWSDEFDSTTVPDDWSITSTTNLAGENILSGANGILVDQLPLNNSNMIYAERGVFAMDFIGAPLVFSFREVFNDDGIINRGAVASFMGQHLVVGQRDIYIHNGSTKRSLVDKRVRRTFFSELRDPRSVFCQVVAARSEVWVCYATDGSADAETANKALVYNYSQDAFTFIDIPNCRALTIGDKLVTIGGWDTTTFSNTSWNESNDYWSSVSPAPTTDRIRIYGASYSDNKVYEFNSGWSANGSSYNAFLEATKIDLDKVLQTSTSSVKQIRQIVPQIEGSGNLTVRVGASNSPQGGITWQPEKTYTIDSDYKIDTRVSGRYLALRFESTSDTDFWRITGLDLDVAEVSGR